MTKTTAYPVFVADGVPEALQAAGLKPRYVQACLWFLSSVYTSAVIRDGTAPMYSLVLRTMMGGGYKKLVRTMLSLGLVELVRKHWKQGGRCRQYDIGQDLRCKTWRVVYLDDHVMCKRIHHCHEAHWKHINADTMLTYLSQCLAEVEVQLPSLAELEAMAKTRPTIDSASRRRRAAAGWSGLASLALHRPLTTCRTNRVFTGFTNLPREFRSLVSLRGEPLVGVDVRNSQPLILCAVIRERAPELLERGDGREYLELCQKGILYDDLMAVSGLDREKCKHGLLSRVFFNPPPASGTPRYLVARAFKSRFPSVWEFIQDIKQEDRCTDDGGRNEKAHAQLAVLLQQKEVDIVLRTAGEPLRAQQIPILTLHDCLVTTPTHVLTVEEAMRQAFHSHGLSAAFKQEFFASKPAKAPSTGQPIAA